MRRRGPSYCSDCELAEQQWEQISGLKRNQQDPLLKRGAGNTLLLADPEAKAAEVKADLKLINWALREKFPLNRRIKVSLVHRLAALVEKKTMPVPVPSEGGPILMDLEGPADSNAIQAGRALIAMAAHNLAVEIQDAKTKEPPAQPGAVSINLQVNNNVDARRNRLSTIAARLGVGGMVEGTIEADPGSNP